MDAWSLGTRLTPDDAYRFARGEEVSLYGGRLARLERPLDFAAVSDHAEFLGEVSVCLDPDSGAHQSQRCRNFRGEGQPSGGGGVVRSTGLGSLSDQGPPFAEFPGGLRFGWSVRTPELCGAEFSRCLSRARSVWAENVAAARRWNDGSSACTFSTFAAYEYSWTPQLSKVHRNVIFRGDEVPPLPVSAIEAREPLALWKALRRECLDAGTGCEVLAIPHNSNLSDGRMFSLELEGLAPEDAREQASLRAELEPLVEIMQIKGDSECRNDLARVAGGRDELCDFEQYRASSTPDCGEGTSYGALVGGGCVKAVDYVRYALVEGLRQERALGVNPLKLGITASTDTHNGTPGDTEEFSYQGSHGKLDDTSAKRLAAPGDFGGLIRFNPGGLFGVWAEENSRDALFDAMQRRETFGTSGVRIAPRFFGAWQLDADLCNDPRAIERADAAGVPMGADLPVRPGDAGVPVFLAAASRDPGSASHAGGRLERIQIVKGWADAAGLYHQAIYDVAGSTEGPVVDPATCTPTTAGADSLCAVWRDPDFDPETAAVYYTRVVEVPSCRWSARACAALPADERPSGCTDPATPKLIRERAWTSPIWYGPLGGAGG
jgi:hypothetical protein